MTEEKNDEYFESIVEELQIPKIKYADDKINELKRQFIEMSQLKSDFDIEKFTTMKQGKFIAHNFHFMMRQYSLTLYEVKRMLLDREEMSRNLGEYNDKLEAGEKKITLHGEFGPEEKYIDLEIQKLMNRIDGLELSIYNKYKSCSMYEQIRHVLIEKNGGEAPTNEQYQLEEPKYWEWFLKKAALAQRKQALTGIQEGVWTNIQHLEEPSVINPDFQLDILEEDGLLDFKKLNDEMNLALGMKERIKNKEIIKEEHKKLE